MKPVVALVGRPNVGKSSLFNRILGRPKAIVEDTPGVTRDRNYAIAEFDRHEFILVDTGGFEEGDAVGPVLNRQVREHALRAAGDADVVVQVMDIRAGITPTDQELFERLRRTGRPFLVALNKADHEAQTERDRIEFYALGFEEVYPVSAAHARGVADLLEEVVRQLPAISAAPRPEFADVAGIQQKRPKRRRKGRLSDEMMLEAAPVGAQDRFQTASSQEEDDDAGWGWEGELPDSPDELPEGFAEAADSRFDVADDEDFVLRVSVLGRPNVGKSTLINRLLGYRRTIVSDVAGTTRDAVDTYFEREGRRYVLVDTAGVRRRARIDTQLERFTASRAIRIIEACHLVMLVIDADEGPTDQEATLARLAADRGRGLLLLINKVDLIDNDPERNRRQVLDRMWRKLPHVAYAPVQFISARTGKGIHRIWQLAEDVSIGHRLRVPTAQLNRWLRDAMQRQPPPLHHHHRVRIHYATQYAVRPPTFVLFSNTPEALKGAYLRYLENRFRDAFDCHGSPLRFYLRKKRKIGEPRAR